MARGVPLTPEQIERAAEVFERTGTYQSAADDIGVHQTAVMRALKRRGEQTRTELHARALARGMRQARRCLTSVMDRLTRTLLEEAEAGGMEPQHMAALANAIAKQSDSITNLDGAAERRLNGRATRAKTKAEIAALRTNSVTGDISLHVAVAGDPVEVRADETPGGDLPQPE